MSDARAAARKAWKPNDKLDRATDKTLPEVDRIEYKGSTWLKVSVAILNLNT